MTHRNAGRYAAKHGQGAGPDERIAGAVRRKVREGEFACAAAEKVGAELGVTMAEVGRTLDLLEIRIKRCQLGLFGYDREQKGLKPADRLDGALEKAILGRLSEGRLSCIAAWEIAAENGIPRRKLSSACEALKIRINHCQLGAF